LCLNVPSVSVLHPPAGRVSGAGSRDWTHGAREKELVLSGLLVHSIQNVHPNRDPAFPFSLSFSQTFLTISSREKKNSPPPHCF